MPNKGEEMEEGFGKSEVRMQGRREDMNDIENIDRKMRKQNQKGN